MKIKVEHEHIDGGLKKSCRQCPIALAVQAVVPTSVSVWDTYVIMNERSYRLPHIARQFIHDFDNDLTVVPFEFELPLEDS